MLFFVRFSYLYKIMALDFKKVIFFVCLFFVFSSCIFCIFTIQWKRQTNDVIGPGIFSERTLKSVSILFRHGNRAPIFKYDTDPHKNAFPEGKGELTKKGKQHMYKKGQIFRRLYNGFLSNLYLDNEILIKTTNKRRTFMSAAMVLAGMYPPTDYQKWSDTETVWQPIPIYNDSPDHGTLFDERGKCAAFDSMINKIYIQLSNHTNENNTRLLSYLSENCGQPITYTNIIKLYDLFLCQIAEDLPLPEWIKPYHFETIKSITRNKKNSKIFFENRRFQKIVIGSLLNEIGFNMETSSNNNDTRKVYLYSGHDISIAMAMSFLGHTIELPNFGASLHFHMYHSEMKEHTIKVYFYDSWDNEKGKEISIPTCGNPCKLKDFKNILDNNLFGKFEDECQQLEI